MDNLDSAIEYGYITEKEAELLELLRMPAKDARPPKGVPKTHVPKKGGKVHPKETLKKLSPKQKATLKAKTDGKVDKTKHGIDSFMIDGSYGSTDHTSNTGGSTTNSGGDTGGGGNDPPAGVPGYRGNAVGSAGASNYTGDGEGGQVNMDSVGGDTGNVLRQIAGKWTIVDEATGEARDSEGRAISAPRPAAPVVRPAVPTITPASYTTPALPADFMGPASSMSIANPSPQIGGTTLAGMMTAAINAGQPSTTPRADPASSYGAPGGASNPANTSTGGGQPASSSYDGDVKYDPNGMQGTQAGNAFGGYSTANNAAYSGSKPTTVTGVPSTPGNTAGKADRENVTTITQNGSIINKTDPDRPYGANTTNITKTVPSDLNDVMPAVTAAERAIMGQVKQPTTFARIDSPSSLATLGAAGSVFESPMADRPGMYDTSELSGIVSGNTPARANAPTREAYAENAASDPTAGRVNSSQASLTSLGGGLTKNYNKDTSRAPTDNLANNYAAYRSPPSQGSIDAARSAILGDVAQAAGTPTAPYDVKAQAAGTLTTPYNPTAIAAGTLTAPYDPVATAAGTLTAPYNPTKVAALTGSPPLRDMMPNYGEGPALDTDLDPQIEGRLAETKLPGYGVPDVPQATPKDTVVGKTDAETSLANYEAANAIPGVTPAIAAGTLTSPYNVKPDTPLSPLATVKPTVKQFGPSSIPSTDEQLAAYFGNGPAPDKAAGTPAGTFNIVANDNQSALQGVRDNTIADQSLPGGLPSVTSPGGPSFGQGGQPAPTGQPAGGTTPPPPSPPPPPPPVAEQTDPYAGIMPWDHIAYDAIKASVEATGQTYTPAQFIASFYNQKKAA